LWLIAIWHSNVSCDRITVHRSLGSPRFRFSTIGGSCPTVWLFCPLPLWCGFSALHSGLCRRDGVRSVCAAVRDVRQYSDRRGPHSLDLGHWAVSQRSHEPRLGGKDDGRDAGSTGGHRCRGLPNQRCTSAGSGSIAAVYPKGMADATGGNLRRFWPLEL
jgi:hypothetical protein